MSMSGNQHGHARPLASTALSAPKLLLAPVHFFAFLALTACGPRQGADTTATKAHAPAEQSPATEPSGVGQTPGPDGATAPSSDRAATQPEPRAAGAAAEPVTLHIACGGVGLDRDLCARPAHDWAAKTGHRVVVADMPYRVEDQLAFYLQLLGEGASDLDVFQIDVLWSGLLAEHFIDLAPHARGAETRHLPAFIENNTVDGKLVALPWFLDGGLLYYRKDLLAKHGARVPETWAELTETARRIQAAERAAGNAGMWGFVWQGKSYEGLTCNALEWIASHGGGTVVDASGKVTIDNPGAVRALELAASWIGTISPRGVLAYGEEEVRAFFESGNAVFMRNWPYAWTMSQGDRNLRDKVGVAPLPKDGQRGQRASTLGGSSLAVSRYSNHPELAAELVLYMAGAEEQRGRASEYLFNPTIPALYQDPELLRAQPVLEVFFEAFQHAVARPSSQARMHYSQVSEAFSRAVHEVLSGKARARARMRALARELERIKGASPGW